MEWIISLLIVTSAATHGLEYFPLNYLITEKNAKVKCDIENKFVSWTLNGQVLEDGAFGGIIHVNGSLVEVDEVDIPVLGEYTCWSVGQKISSTFLLLEVEEEDSLESLRCRAKSYHCSFTCTWQNSGYDVARLRLSRGCGTKSCQWVNSSVRNDGTFLFEMSHSVLPYAEESTMLELTFEAIVNHFILKRTKRFYLRDIIQPDSPHVVSYQMIGKELSMTIEPPPSWSSPHSFFSLENEIQYVLKDDGQIMNSSSTLIQGKISRFRVRCRDSYALSAWSPWTTWKDVSF